jgi:hypothetical protein
MVPRDICQEEAPALFIQMLPVHHPRSEIAYLFGVIRLFLWISFLLKDRSFLVVLPTTTFDDMSFLVGHKKNDLFFCDFVNLEAFHGISFVEAVSRPSRTDDGSLAGRKEETTRSAAEAKLAVKHKPRQRVRFSPTSLYPLLPPPLASTTRMLALRRTTERHDALAGENLCTRPARATA